MGKKKSQKSAKKLKGKEKGVIKADKAKNEKKTRRCKRCGRKLN